jgi:putative FmdB family regulatory protein
MPIYERKCKSCGTVSSHLCKVADRDEPKDCPNCGGTDTQPIMSPTKTTFKFADRTGLKP